MVYNSQPLYIGDPKSPSYKINFDQPYARIYTQMYNPKNKVYLTDYHIFIRDNIQFEQKKTCAYVTLNKSQRQDNPFQSHEYADAILIKFCGTPIFIVVDMHAVSEIIPSTQIVNDWISRFGSEVETMIDNLPGEVCYRNILHEFSSVINLHKAYDLGYEIFSIHHQDGPISFEVHYKVKHPILIYRDDSESGIYDHLVYTIDQYSHIFIGIDPNDSDNRGNTILIEVDKHKYIYISNDVISFEIDDEIMEYRSPIENGMPYPIGIGKKYTYLFAYYQKIMNTDISANKYPWNIYDFLDRKHMLNDTSEIEYDVIYRDQW